MALRQIPDSDTLREAFDTTYDNDRSVEQQLGSKAAGDHTHEGYAPTVHTHDYSPFAHSHANYQALLETNLDLLMRGLLYTKASPFSQSFTFSGDGAKTAFKVPRADVQQQGWVRGGVSATVDGTSVSGTWNIHTQTYMLSAAPASGASVVVSSTDVVPYQGVSDNGQLEIVYLPYEVLVTTSGTSGGNTSNLWEPASVKLPVPEQDTSDDSLLGDSISSVGYQNPSGKTVASFPNQGFDSYQVKAFSGMTLSYGAKTVGAPRGGGVTDVPGFGARTVVWRANSLSNSIPRLSFVPFLVKDSFGELWLALAADVRTNNYVQVTPRANNDGGAFDLFRLSGGPILEAA